MEEIENSEIKQLANRLKAVSDKETLTNVLEWQDRNIVFWFERYPLSHILLVSIVFFAVSVGWNNSCDDSSNNDVDFSLR